MYCYFLNEFFDGQECDACSCLAMKNNGRDRTKSNSSRGSSCASASSNLNVLDGIHAALLHGYDTGHKLYMHERLALRAMPETTNEECFDLEAEHLRSMVSNRRERHKHEIQDMRFIIKKAHSRLDIGSLSKSTPA